MTGHGGWKSIVSAGVMAFVALLGTMAASAWACPFCGEANADDADRVAAFQTSILFMLAMPMLVFGLFAYGLYRLNRRETGALGEADESAAPVGEFSPAGPVHSASDSKPVGSSQ